MMMVISYLSGAELDDVSASAGATAGRTDCPIGGLILSPTISGAPDNLIFCETGALILAPTGSLILALTGGYSHDNYQS